MSNRHDLRLTYLSVLLGLLAVAALIASIWHLRWLYAALGLLLAAFMLSNLAWARIVKDTSAEMARAAAWHERLYVIGTLNEAVTTGKPIRQWADEYLSYVGAHAVADGYPVKIKFGGDEQA